MIAWLTGHLEKVQDMEGRPILDILPGIAHILERRFQTKFLSRTHLQSYFEHHNPNEACRGVDLHLESVLVSPDQPHN